MKVQTILELIRKNDKEFGFGENETIIIKSAFNWKNERVVIEIENEEYEVDADELLSAINNATNCR